MDFDAIRMIWLRDLIRHFRDRVRLLGSIIRPVLWLLIMGTGLRAAFNVHGVSYTHFIFPGIIAMNLIFSAMQSTISIIWDREFVFFRCSAIMLSFTLLHIYSGGLALSALANSPVVTF